MNNEYQLIDEAIYDLGDLHITRKKKNPLASIIVLLVGVGLTASVYTVEAIQSNANLSSALILIGGITAIIGLVKTLICLFHKGLPVYKPTGERLRRFEFFYEAANRDRVCDCVRRGDFKALAEIPQSNTSAIIAILYKTPGDNIALAQVLEFIPHFHRPVMETQIFPKGGFKTAENLA